MLQSGGLRDFSDLLVGEDVKAVPAGVDALPLGDRRQQIVRMNDRRGEAKSGKRSVIFMWALLSRVERQRMKYLPSILFF